MAGGIKIYGPMAVLAATLLAGVAWATNSDVGKEQRWAEQVIDGLLDGDEVWLTDPGGHRFLGIFTEGEGDGAHAVILVHGIGVHPDWPDVIYPLREGLLEHGTTTLSIQMPILANEAESKDYAPLMEEVPGRFQAAQAYLTEAGYEKISIVAHSLGSTMSAYYLSDPSASGVSAFVAIGMGSGIKGTIDNPQALSRIKLDMLDLYGGQDLEPVLAGAPERAARAGSRDGASYRQVVVEGANHFFQGHEDALKQQVIDWLDATIR